MSALATCEKLLRDAPPVRCGEPLLLYISRSPMARYESLIVEACPACGIQTVLGVVAHQEIQAEGGL